MQGSEQSNSKDKDEKPKLEFLYNQEDFIGNGAFGKVYKAYTKDSKDKKYAVKISDERTVSIVQLRMEHELYLKYQKCPHIPKVYDYKEENGRAYMYMDLLGKNFESIRVNIGKNLAPNILYPYMTQMIEALKEFHSKGYIHRDIKPENFVQDLHDSKKIYILDFGLSEPYIIDNKHKPDSQVKTSLTGTPRYASINALEGGEQSRRDDLESLFYVWCFLLKGNLPWQRKLDPASKNPYACIIEIKKECLEKFSINDTANIIPKTLNQYLKRALVNYIQSVRKLKFADEPKYDEYINYFKNCKFDNSTGTKHIVEHRKANTITLTSPKRYFIDYPSNNTEHYCEPISDASSFDDFCGLLDGSLCPRINSQYTYQIPEEANFTLRDFPVKLDDNDITSVEEIPKLPLLNLNVFGFKSQNTPQKFCIHIEISQQRKNDYYVPQTVAQTAKAKSPILIQRSQSDSINIVSSSNSFK